MPQYIKTKSDLQKFLNVELKIISRYTNLKLLKWFPIIIYEDQIKYRFIKTLRKAEYFTNSNKKLRGFFYRLKFFHLQTKYCLNIPMNCCDIGLNIVHVGPIIINDNCLIGKNFKVNVGVNIGNNEFKSHNKCPTIGDNVFIGPGAKLFGDIIIANGCRIGANAVVNKSHLIENSTIVGVPAIQKNIFYKGNEDEK